VLALQAADELRGGISCEIVDLRTLNPLDADTFIASARKTGRAVVVEECWRSAGLAAISPTAFTKRVSTVCWPGQTGRRLDVPMPYSREIENCCIPRAETIASAVRERAGRSV